MKLTVLKKYKFSVLTLVTLALFGASVGLLYLKSVKAQASSQSYSLDWNALTYEEYCSDVSPTSNVCIKSQIDGWRVTGTLPDSSQLTETWTATEYQRQHLTNGCTNQDDDEFHGGNSYIEPKSFVPYRGPGDTIKYWQAGSGSILCWQHSITTPSTATSFITKWHVAGTINP